MPVEMIAKTDLGICAKMGEIVMKLVQTVYIVGAHALGAESDMRTSRNLRKSPVGSSTALTSPPTAFPLFSPSFHAGMYGAAAASAAPIICAGMLDTRKPRYTYENIRNLGHEEVLILAVHGCGTILEFIYVEASGVW